MNFAYPLAAVFALSATALAQTIPQETPPVNTAALMPPPSAARDAAAELESRYECAGTILHQLHAGELESDVTFRFGIGRDGAVSGVVDAVGPPLDLASHKIKGRLRARHDTKGTMVGGRIKIAWPYTLNGEGVQLSIMRETFIRIGPRINGFAKVKLRTSKHLYVAGNIRFDPTSHPSLDGLVHTAFVQATCKPDEAG